MTDPDPNTRPRPTYSPRRQAQLDRLSQLHDEDLDAVVMAVQNAVMFGEGWLRRTGIRMYSDTPEQFRERERAKASQRRSWERFHELRQKLDVQEEAEASVRFQTLYDQAGQVIFRQEYEEDT